MNEAEQKRLSGVVETALKLDKEKPTLELKSNFDDPDKIGQYISALSNSATLDREDRSYLIWGIDDNHKVIGTNFDPKKKKVGNEDLIPWLMRYCEGAFFEFYDLTFEDKLLIILEVNPAREKPTRFKGSSFVRLETYNKRLQQYPEIERKLWDILSREAFETLTAKMNLSAEDVHTFLDIDSYFKLSHRTRAENSSQLMEMLEQERLIKRIGLEAFYAITNLGALTFAKDLGEFETLSSKSPRVIVYEGTSREAAASIDQIGQKGYAIAFEGLVNFINGSLPHQEKIGEALRTNKAIYPPLAIRELVANALIHQELSQRGSRPIIEIFTDRVEISNPGTPVVEMERFIDTAPRSRNEILATLMRRLGVCEERGSGWDKVTADVELAQLPAPRIDMNGPDTRVTLFGPKHIRDMDRDERIRAVYQHASLKFVRNDYLTNTSLRERFGLGKNQSPKVSGFIREATEANKIRPHDPAVGAKSMKYVPYWA